jgi:voltage-gated potassium channel
MDEQGRPTFRDKVWDLVEAHDHDFDGRRELDWLDKFTIGLVLANVVAIILSTDPGVVARVGPAFFWFQWASVIYFTLEYAVRIWACTADDENVRPVMDRVHYMTSFMGIVDFLAVAPFYLALLYPGVSPRALEGLMLFRLFWLLKLGRYSNTVSRMDDIVRSKSKELAAAFSLVGVLIVLAAAGMWFFEKDTQPDKFGTIPLSMWWSVVTLTTIGYGDVFPTTIGGRVFASFVALAGIGMIALPAGILASAFSAEFTKAEVEQQLDDVCPTCKRPHDRE